LHDAWRCATIIALWKLTESCFDARLELFIPKIGPLRYQASTSDCVPTTIINGVSILLEAPLHPKLHQLIWALAGDHKNGGTGWVCCDTLAALLSRWFQRAHQDERAGESLPFTSEIIEGDSINLKRGGKLLRCLSSGGVACLATGKNADHYALLIGTDEDYFLGFDSWWDKKTAKRLEAFVTYKGMVNIKWNRTELETELQQSSWVHLLGRVNS
jgi:hypothetical protein